MLKLVETTSYNVGNLIVTVQGLNCSALSAVYPICSAMDLRTKARLKELAKDEELAALVMKSQGDDMNSLSPEEKFKVVSFMTAHSEDFSLQECSDLVCAFMDSIISVKQGEEDVTEDFKQSVGDSPAYTRAIANICYTEYKAATEVPDIKKI